MDDKKGKIYAYGILQRMATQDLPLKEKALDWSMSSFIASVFLPLSGFPEWFPMSLSCPDSFHVKISSAGGSDRLSYLPTTHLKDIQLSEIIAFVR